MSSHGSPVSRSPSNSSDRSYNGQVAPLTSVSLLRIPNSPDSFDNATSKQQTLAYIVSHTPDLCGQEIIVKSNRYMPNPLNSIFHPGYVQPADNHGDTHHPLEEEARGVYPLLQYHQKLFDLRGPNHRSPLEQFLHYRDVPISADDYGKHCNYLTTALRAPAPVAVAYAGDVQPREANPESAVPYPKVLRRLILNPYPKKPEYSRYLFFVATRRTDSEKQFQWVASEALSPQLSTSPSNSEVYVKILAERHEMFFWHRLGRIHVESVANPYQFDAHSYYDHASERFFY